MTIRIENVYKSFKDFQALSDVSLTVKKGELIALLGPSGSGKTTLLRIIAGLETADKGEIFLGSEKAATTPVRERRVGFVFQHYALFRHMTVFENIAFGLRIKSKKTRLSDDAIEEKVMELIGLVHLQGMHNRYPSQLSGGQRQRVALARALAVDPKVLLLDEPFGALDAKVRKELRRWLIRLHEELNITTIFVTHDQEEAMELADRVVVMNEGRIEQTGTPSEIYHHPANAFVYDFIGNYNAFTGWRHEGADSEYKLAVPGGEIPRGCVTASMFARPYDMEITTDKNASGAFSVRILHVNPAGPMVTVEMEDCDGKMLQAALSHDKFSSLNLSKGLDVFVRPRDLRVFEK